MSSITVAAYRSIVVTVEVLSDHKPPNPPQCSLELCWKDEHHSSSFNDGC